MYNQPYAELKARLSLTYAAKANAAIGIYSFDNNGVFYVIYISTCLLYFALYSYFTIAQLFS